MNALPAWLDEDERRSVRQPVRLCVDVEYRGTGPILADMTDLTELGCRLQLVEHIPVGQCLTVTVGRKTKLRGWVAWSKGREHGFSIADGPIGSLPNRRSIFDTFWREVTGEHGGNPHSATYYRASMGVTCLQQIGRQLGQPALFFNLVREARLPERRAAEVRRCGSRGWGRA